MKKTFGGGIILFLILLTNTNIVSAQTPPCGEIVGPDPAFLPSLIGPITNCADPFSVTVDPVSPYQVIIGGEVIEEGGEAIVDPDIGFQLELNLIGAPGFAFAETYLYKRSGQDYQYVDLSDSMTEGDYTLVIYESEPILTEGSLWENIHDFFVPKAHADFRGYNLYTLNFSVTLGELPFYSNVLFLPGIQASRLYKDGILGTEDQLWEPNINGDVEQLVMDENGVSQNEIYTKDVVDEVFGVSNIYQSFIDELDELKGNNEIVDYNLFAYDWRHSVASVLENGVAYDEGEIKNLFFELENLAFSSHTGKVTIVAHSNGGLLAKLLINKLVEDGFESYVDKVIFVGTPHLGTPKALASILHGYDQQKLGGLIIDDVETREVINNMPGVYGLIPTQKYLAENDPTFLIDFSSSTAFLTNAYGGEISSLAEYKDFLNGSEGRVNNFADINSPVHANEDMLNDALSLHDASLDNWQAPAGIEVHNIVGVGLPTVKALNYREVLEKQCEVDSGGQIVCEEYVGFLRPYALFTRFGDETVVSASAEGVEGETRYFDLYALDLDGNAPDITHANFLEVDEILDFVKNTLTDTDANYQYLSTTKPNIQEEVLILSIDSPANVLATDEEGKKAGKEGGNFLEEINGSQYFEMAGTKYLLLPANRKYTFVLLGEDHGGYTLKVKKLKINDEEEALSELKNATVTPDLVAQFSYEANAFSNLETDLDGDGVLDSVTDLNGLPVEEEEEVTFATVRADILDLGLHKGREIPLLALLTIAEKLAEKGTKYPHYKRQASKTLDLLKFLVSSYQKKKWITKAQGDELLATITELQVTLK